MKPIASILAICVLMGCGGSGEGEAGTLVLESASEGHAAFSASYTASAETNADPSTFDLNSGSSLNSSVRIRDENRGVFDFTVTTTDGRTLAFSVVGDAAAYPLPLVAGTTIPLTPGYNDAGAVLRYAEYRPKKGVYRSWEAKSGAIVIDAVEEGVLTAHISGAEMVAGTGGIYTDSEGKHYIPDSATGDFLLDVQVRLVRPQGGFVVTTSESANYLAIDPLTAASEFVGFSTKGNSLTATFVGSRTGLTLRLIASGRTLRVGDTFAIGGRGSLRIDQNVEGQTVPRKWTGRSGVATVKDIRGRTVTLEVASAILNAGGGGATGTLALSGTLSAYVP